MASADRALVAFLAGVILLLATLALAVSHDAPYRFTHGPGCVTYYDP